MAKVKEWFENLKETDINEYNRLCDTVGQGWPGLGVPVLIFRCTTL